jgi:hypothetical protein
MINKIVVVVVVFSRDCREIKASFANDDDVLDQSHSIFDIGSTKSRKRPTYIKLSRTIQAFRILPKYFLIIEKLKTSACILSQFFLQHVSVSYKIWRLTRKTWNFFPILYFKMYFSRHVPICPLNTQVLEIYSSFFL